MRRSDGGDCEGAVVVGMTQCSPVEIYTTFRKNWGARWRSWLRHCATNRSVAGSIPDGVTEIFH
jgi:hypothetical protein